MRDSNTVGNKRREEAEIKKVDKEREGQECTEMVLNKTGQGRR